MTLIYKSLIHMPDLSNDFKTFLENLKIPQSKYQRLIKSREASRNRIRKYFQANHPHLKPEFWIQGSVKNSTIIRTKEDECDLDDGVYFFPKPKESPEDLQKMIKNAFKDLKSPNAIHKKHCIRLIYQGDYNIDLPILYMEEKNDGKAFIAVKSGEWAKDDPKAFTEWLRERKKSKGEQLVRIVKYLKAWSDNVRKDMPNGLIMTILGSEYIKLDERDDIALKNTLETINEALTKNWICRMPTRPKNNLLDNFNDDWKSRFFKSLREFIDDAINAIESESYQIANELWKKHLGKWFPEYDETEKSDNVRKIGNALKEGTLAFGVRNSNNFRSIKSNPGYYKGNNTKPKNLRLQEFKALRAKLLKLYELRDEGIINKFIPIPLFDKFKCKIKLNRNLTLFIDNENIESDVDFSRYEIEIHLNKKLPYPQVFITEPKLLKNPPHIFTNEGSLCLIHPENFDWNNEKSAIDTIFGWTLGWIYFYEKWLKTGIWFGPEEQH